MEDVKIRPYRENDELRLMAFYIELYPKHSQFAKSPVLFLKKVGVRLASPFKTYVAEVTEAVQGFIHFQTTPGEVEVRDLFVESIFRGRGIARKLLNVPVGIADRDFCEVSVVLPPRSNLNYGGARGLSEHWGMKFVPGEESRRCDRMVLGRGGVFDFHV